MNIYYWRVGDYTSDKDLYTYCAGIVMIAANSEEEARNILVEQYIDLFSQECSYIDLDLIYKLENVTANVENPKVLIEEYYIE